MAEPALGALSPLFIVQALVSSCPVVKKVIKFKISYDFFINKSKPDSSGKPKEILSSFKNNEDSSSSAILITKELFGLSLKYLSASSNLPFNKYNLGFNVNNCKLFNISFSSSENSCSTNTFCCCKNFWAFFKTSFSFIDSFLPTFKSPTNPSSLLLTVSKSFKISSTSKISLSLKGLISC